MDQRFLVLALVVVPVLSVCLGFTVHYAIRPLVEALLDAIHDLSGVFAGGEDAGRIARLESEVARLRAEVQDLRGAPSLGAPTGSDGDPAAGRLPPGSV